MLRIIVKYSIITLLLLIVAIIIAKNIDFDKKEYHESVQKIIRITNSDSTGLKYSIPVWSPDGKNIAYSDYNGEFYYADFNGVLIKKLKDTEIYNGTTGLNWSRDGRFVAYLSYSGMSSIRVIDLKNYTVKEVARNKWLSDPFWIFTKEGQKVSTISDMGIQYFSDNFENNVMFPDKILNRNIVYISVKGDTYIDENGVINDSVKLGDMFTNLSFDKKLVTHVFNGKLFFYNIERKITVTVDSPYDDTDCLCRSIWSNDGKQILITLEKYAVEDNEPLQFDIALYDLETKKFIRLTNTDNHVEERLSFSPDNKKIIFNDYRDGNIYIMYIK